MRALLSVLVLAPLPIMADTISVSSKATSAIIYSEGAQVTHSVQVSVPAGQHELVFTNLPEGLELEYLRLSSDDLKIGTVRFREDYVPPVTDQPDPAIDKAEARIEAIEDEIEAVHDRARLVELEAEAAGDQISFLSALGSNDGLPATPDALRDIARMIGAETLNARQIQIEAEIKTRGIRDELKDLKEELENARAALRALVPEPEDKPFLSVSVTAEGALDGAQMNVSYFADAGWTPVYDIHLDTEPTAQVTFDRAFWVYQGSGENWENIDLTLSSETPTSELEPVKLRPALRRLVDPELAQKRVRTFNGVAMDALIQPVTEAPVLVEEANAASASVAGLGIEYTFSGPVSIANEADSLRLPFDSLTFDAEIIARAVPYHEETAFLIAEFTNDSGEPLPGSEEGARLFEGALVGVGYTELITAGETREIGFGAIKGLTVQRTVTSRAEGDRGIISRSNEKTENTRIDLENLTDRTWNVELLDRVPYSEQEDLEITYTTDPAPDVQDVDDRRGILQWNIEMEPGNEATISTQYKMTWPEGQIVR